MTHARSYPVLLSLLTIPTLLVACVEPGATSPPARDLEPDTETSVSQALANPTASRWLIGGFHGTYGTWFADVNGDGMADGIGINDNDVWVTLSTGAGFAFPERWLVGGFHGTRGTWFADVDGDGKADGIGVNDDDIWVMRSTGSSASGFAFPERWLVGGFHGTRGTWFADIDGDGKADGIGVNDDDIWVLRSTGSSQSGFAFPLRWLVGRFYGSITTAFVNVNHDRKADGIAVNGDDIWTLPSSW